MRIRAAGGEDLDPVGRVQAQSRRAAYDGLVPDRALQSLAAADGAAATLHAIHVHWCSTTAQLWVLDSRHPRRARHRRQPGADPALLPTGRVARVSCC